MRRNILIITIVSIVMISGCAGTMVPETKTTEDTSETHYVHIYEDSIKDNTIEIDKGDTVLWIVHDGTHIIAANDETWESKKLVEGDRYKKTFYETGTFNYHCHLHSHNGDGDATIIVK